MKQNVRVVNKFKYHTEDCECRYCSNNKKGGCKFKITGDCPFNEIKREAIMKGRIKRKRGFNNWES